VTLGGVTVGYELVFTEDFKKGLAKLDKSIKDRLPKVFDKIRNNPTQAKPLHGKYNYFRARFENYRIVYHVDEEKKIISCLFIDTRENIYSRFR
jgi:addiction module RelE/StbE family toxin